MNIQILLCDLCNTHIQSEKHGVKITHGQSIGGWGSRSNLIDWSGEVCPTCFSEFQTISNAVSLWLNKRHGSKYPTIIIHPHSVETVSTDNPPPHPPRQLPPSKT